MANDPEFYTVTMAKVYTDQGYFDKAIEIYKYLLEQEPERQDLAEALSNIEKILFEKENNSSKDLVQLFSQWIDLLFTYKKVNKLKNLKT